MTRDGCFRITEIYPLQATTIKINDLATYRSNDTAFTLLTYSMTVFAKENVPAFGKKILHNLF